MMKSLIAAGSVAVLGLTSLPAEAAGPWQFAGMRVVNGSFDVDKISVGPRHNRADKMLLKVRGNDLRVYDVKIHYTSGGVQDVPIRKIIPQGGSTRVIDLNGKNRNIKHVTFRYGKFRNGRGRTFVELWIRK
jgi:hypothetical protein